VRRFNTKEFDMTLKSEGSGYAAEGDGYALDLNPVSI